MCLDDDLEAARSAPFDTDNDGAIDAIEIDADGDGISDLLESGGTDVDNDGIIDGFLEANGDGFDDAIAAVPVATLDSDGDGLPDFQDFDSDNDGISDIEEAGGVDADGDGQADALVSEPNLTDSDGDGIPNFQQPFFEPIAQQPVAEPPVVEQPDGGLAIGAGNEQLPQEPAEEATGRVLTGLEGRGCSVSPYPVSMNSKTSALKRPVDPTLPLLSMLALIGLVVRRLTTFVKR